MTITDKDREAAVRALWGDVLYGQPPAELASAPDVQPIAQYIAQARAEGRAELDAERAAHEATKARLALAEAVCRTLYACPYPPDGVVLDALEAWRAAK